VPCGQPYCLQRELGGDAGMSASVSISCQDASTHGQPEVWQFGSECAVVLGRLFKAMPEAGSTGWGSLVRAQYRPPRESPAAAGFLFSTGP